jgi:hypothetical protein
VTTGPADEQAVPPHRLRASHIDREQAISALKAAYVADRLAKDEFDTRVGQALAARTRAELAVITADIPAGPIGVQPIRSPNQPALGVKSGVCVTGSAAALAVTGVVILTLFVTGYQVRESRHPNRSAGPLPPGTAS